VYICIRIKNGERNTNIKKLFKAKKLICNQSYKKLSKADYSMRIFRKIVWYQWHKCDINDISILLALNFVISENVVRNITI
jgi:hypothetical protein